METNKYEHVRGLSAQGEKCWVNWKFEEVDGRQTKVPYMPTNKRASSNAPETWSTFEEVVVAAERFDGIGIMFSGLLLGVDLDHCVDDNGEVPTDIAAFINQAQTYTEISPSGRGLHVYLRTVLPLELEANRHGGRECYTTGRYFTVSGNPWKESYPVRTVKREEAIELLKMLGYPWKKTVEIPDFLKIGSKAKDDNETLKKRMFGAKNGQEIKALYDGDMSKYDDDESRADAALCAHLAFYTHDPKQIEEIWLGSELGKRDKAHRKDYVERTISNALNFVSKSGVAVTASHDMASTRKKARYRFFKDIKTKPVDWLWPGRIALGKTTLLCGDPGEGKSLITAALAATVSRGYPWPVNGGNAPVGDVVIISAEDGADDTIGPRLEAAEADMSRVVNLDSVVRTKPDGSETEKMFSLKEDLEELGQVLSELPNPKLVIIDPVSAYLSGADSHNNAEMRSLLAPLGRVAEKFNVAIVAVSHLNKNSASTNPLYRIIGSLAFVATARGAYLVNRDKQNPSRRIIYPIKNNLGKDSTAIAFSIMETENEVPVVAWEKEEIPFSREDMLSGGGVDEKLTATDKAELLIRFELGDGPKTASYMEAVAEKEKISDKAMRLARERLGIKPVKETGKANGSFIWELPEHKDVQEVESSHEEDEISP